MPREMLNLNIWLGLVCMPASGHCSWAEGHCVFCLCEFTWDCVKGYHGHGFGDSIFRHNERNWHIVSVQLCFCHTQTRSCERHCFTDWRWPRSSKYHSELVTLFQHTYCTSGFSNGILNDWW